MRAPVIGLAALVVALAAGCAERTREVRQPASGPPGVSSGSRFSADALAILVASLTPDQVDRAWVQSNGAGDISPTPLAAGQVDSVLGWLRSATRVAPAAATCPTPLGGYPIILFMDVAGAGQLQIVPGYYDCSPPSRNPTTGVVSLTTAGSRVDVAVADITAGGAAYLIAPGINAFLGKELRVLGAASQASKASSS